MELCRAGRVSLKEISVCVLDEKGAVAFEGKAAAGDLGGARPHAAGRLRPGHDWPDRLRKPGSPGVVGGRRQVALPTSSIWMILDD
jgi:hypothetical protein